MPSILILNQGLQLHQPLERSVSLTIGNFDGLHSGHQQLVRKAQELAKNTGLNSAVLTFDPHPETFFDNKPRPNLYSTEQRIRALAEIDVDIIIVQEFDQLFSDLTVDQFLDDYLYHQLSVRALVVGSDFQFASKRAGTSVDLLNFGREKGVPIDVVSPILSGKTPVRSSTIRQILSEAGDIGQANRLLGHPFLLEGLVEKGDQRGRTIGFPTLNIAPRLDQLVPRDGVYCGWIALEEEASAFPVLQYPTTAMPCVINIGFRPTVHGSSRRIEAHALDQKLPMDVLYGRHAALYFSEWLRDERKFAGIDDLKAAINADASKARKLFAH